jgi:putative tryptophan/tyrosine transport system substrate-binding protein
MRRREFIGLASGGSVLAATSRAAWAAEPHKIYRIAVLHPSHPISDLTENGRIKYYREFFHELRQLGYIEEKTWWSNGFPAKGVLIITLNSRAKPQLAIPMLFLQSLIRWLPF